MSSVRVSEKHGVNPSLGMCFYCNEEDGTVVLAGRLPGDAEAPRRGVWSMQPCDRCKAHMTSGVILISVDERKTTWRTGGWVVIKEEALRGIIQPPELLAAILKQRVAFVPDDAWDKMGLPRGETGGAS